MPKKLDWRKAKVVKPVVKRDLVKRELLKKNYTDTYREKQFWIGDRLVERYHPDRKQKIETGVFMNARTARFEAWKGGQRIGEMGWKVGQAALKEWLAKFI